MTIHETKMIIRKWICSCETTEQLDVLEGAIKKHFFPNIINEILFAVDGKECDSMLEEARETRNELLRGIEIRKKILAPPSLQSHSTTPIGKDNRLTQLP